MNALDAISESNRLQYNDIPKSNFTPYTGNPSWGLDAPSEHRVPIQPAAPSVGVMTTAQPSTHAVDAASPSTQPSALDTPTTLPSGPLDTPTLNIPRKPVQGKAVDVPLQPVGPSPIVDTVKQTPKRPTSLNPDKFEKPTSTRYPWQSVNIGGSRNGDHQTDRNSSGGLSTGTSGLSGGNLGNSVSNVGGKSTTTSSGYGGNSPGDTAKGHGFGGVGGIRFSRGKLWGR